MQRLDAWEVFEQGELNFPDCAAVAVEVIVRMKLGVHSVLVFMPVLGMLVFVILVTMIIIVIVVFLVMSMIIVVIVLVVMFVVVIVSMVVVLFFMVMFVMPVVIMIINVLSILLPRMKLRSLLEQKRLRIGNIQKIKYGQK